ncbi:MAG TPA: hypothetical protein VFD73_13410 [Gemmatimonadales bacterium]|nr:hypothetical protein [Gemmatimonadales bacterium]
MARTTAQLDDAVLVLPADAASLIPLHMPAWFAWLEHATTFVFTARKKRQAHGGEHCCT